MVHPPPSHTPDERRWTMGAWITLAMALGYLLGGVAYVLAAYGQPSDGWNTVYTAPTGWEVKLNQGGGDVLRVGDRILAIGGRDVGDTFSPPLTPPPMWEEGATARYSVLRDGAALELDVPLVRIAPGELPRYMLLGTDGSNFAALLCLLFGFAVFLLRPGSVAARLLLLILTYFMGTATVWFAFSGPAQLFFPPRLFWAFQSTGVLWPLLFAGATHLALAFPRPVWPLTRWPRRTLGLLYGLPAAGALVTLATFSLAVYATALLGMMLVMACAMVGATTYNLRTARDPVVRAQSAWVGLGFGGTFLFAAMGAIVGLILPGGGEWSGYLFFLALPLCLGVAILRYRLFDIEVIVRRTLVYTVLTLALGAVYLVSVVALQALFVRLTGQASTL
ncbi:MAG TPA: hypothetical protein PKD53_31250, partial [Chloroflexaceae bacterium]|nr:hypothetical protein [Chloroflexaceae bacterium]